MALIDMVSQLTEEVPALSRPQAKRYINRAWRVVEDACTWSYQLQQGSFSTPNVTTAGTFTCALDSNTITGDATASAAWAALPFYWRPAVQQIRAQGFSIYSIIAYDDTDPNAIILTLDRPFTDPLPNFSNVGYQMFMQYIAAPPRFKRWLTIADMFNCWALDLWSSKRTVDLTDPARLYTSNPAMCFGVGEDQRGAKTTTPSATIGQQLYELYPTPQTKIGYQTYYVQLHGPLVNNSDTLPFPITEGVVIDKALTYAYRWAESRKDVMAAKGSGASYITLKRDSETEFATRLKTLRLEDRDAVDSYQVNMRAATNSFRGLMPYFNSTAGRANMGFGG
jgi:hypothetical protein